MVIQKQMVSVIIPSRSPQYLQKTIDDLLLKAEGEIEVIVVLDGQWPKPDLKDDKRVKLLHHGVVHDSLGMRESINRGVAMSTGEYIMKTDEHCMFDQGFDLKLKADCEDNWVVIPRRKRLEPESWTLVEDGRPDIDYMLIDYPFQRPEDKTCGLHGAEWKRPDRADMLIDDTPSMQGSCYFMSRKHWDWMGDLDTEKYGTFTQESQEIGMKTWLSGGRMIVNKKTWYAHWHKGKSGKGYSFSNAQYRIHTDGTERGRLYCRDYWLYTKDYKFDWDWFMQKFPDMPGWKPTWKADIARDSQLETKTLDPQQLKEEVLPPQQPLKKQSTMKNRIELAEFFRDKGFKYGAEIGVCDGRYSNILMDTIPGLRLVGVDPYTEYALDSKGRTQQELSGKLDQAQKLLGGYENYELVICKSIEAAKLVPDGVFDFIFIDANHPYEFVKEDIEAWYPKVRKGGILSGHDYYEFRSGRGGIIQAVDEFVAKHPELELQTTEWDKRPETHRDDRQPDWYFEIK